jgi:hypothetical protein
VDRQSNENHKALRLILGPLPSQHLGISGLLATGPRECHQTAHCLTMDYDSDEVIEVAGNNRNGGSKNLIVSLVNCQFKLYIA